MYNIRQLTIKEILHDAPYIMETLEEALIHCVKPGWTATDFVQHAIADPVNYHVWAIESLGGIVAFGATRVFNYPQHDALNVLALANVRGYEGVLKFIGDITDQLEEKAIEAGFKKMELTGRKGWERIHPDYNFDYLVISKDLENKDG